MRSKCRCLDGLSLVVVAYLAATGCQTTKGRDGNANQNQAPQSQATDAQDLSVNGELELSGRMPQKAATVRPKAKPPAAAVAHHGKKERGKLYRFSGKIVRVVNHARTGRYVVTVKTRSGSLAWLVVQSSEVTQDMLLRGSPGRFVGFRARSNSRIFYLVRWRMKPAKNPVIGPTQDGTDAGQVPVDPASPDPIAGDPSTDPNAATTSDATDPGDPSTDQTDESVTPTDQTAAVPDPTVATDDGSGDVSTNAVDVSTDNSGIDPSTLPDDLSM